MVERGRARLGAGMDRLWRMARRGSLAGGAAAALAVRGIEIGGKFGLYFLAALLLGAEESGYLFLCLTWVHVLSTLSRAGFDRALIRHVSAEAAVGRHGAAVADIRRGLGWSTALSVAMAAVSWVSSDVVAVRLFGMPGLAPSLHLAAIAIVLQTITVMLCAVLVGLGRSVVAQGLQNAWWPVGLLVALLAGARSAEALVAALAVASLAAAAVCLRLIAPRWRILRQPDVPHRDGGTVAELPPLARTARPLALVEVVQVSLSNLPVLLLATVAGPAVVAAFSIANRMSQLVWVVLISISTVAAPRVGAAHRRGETATLAGLNRGMQAAGAVVAGGGAAVMAVAAGPLLGLVGPEYAMAASALTMMALGQLVNALFSGQDTMLAMTGHGWVLGRINLVQVSLCVAGGLTLIPLFAMPGAAVVAALPVAVGSWLTAAAVRRLLPQAAPVVPPAPDWVMKRLFGRRGAAATVGN